MKNHSLIVALTLTSAVALGASDDAFAFGYIFAGEDFGVDIVTHSIGYTGTGGDLFVTVGIDPTSANAAAMQISVQNVVATWNGMTPTTGNLGTDPSMGFLDIDFESVLLHEMGHSLGLTHINAATESGLSGSNQNYTKTTNGTDNVFNINAGVDGVIGSADDVRGDDVNLNYFHKATNDPFAIANANGVVDSTTYSRDLADLPGGDLFSANADRDVSVLYGASGTEASMQQGSFNNEIQRTLGADDVAGIKYAESGLDEIAGTADDYDLILEYVVLEEGETADITIAFDDSETGFAVSQSSATSITSDHWRIVGNEIYFNSLSGSSLSWYFNDTLVPEPTSLAPLAIGGMLILRRRRQA